MGRSKIWRAMFGTLSHREPAEPAWRSSLVTLVREDCGLPCPRRCRAFAMTGPGCGGGCVFLAAGQDPGLIR